jgi:hypothetical protein
MQGVTLFHLTELLVCNIWHMTGQNFSVNREIRFMPTVRQWLKYEVEILRVITAGSCSKYLAKYYCLILGGVSLHFTSKKIREHTAICLTCIAGLFFCSHGWTINIPCSVA